MQKYIGKFIGPNKIKELVLMEQKTPLGNKVYSVVYEGGFEELVTSSTLELCASDSLSDFTVAQQIKLNALVKKIIELIAEYDIRLYEMEMVSKLLNDSIAKSTDKALSYKWYGSLKQHIDGKDPISFFSILEVDGILKDAASQGTDIPAPEPKMAENA